MVVKKITTLVLGLGLVFGGAVAPIHAHAKNVVMATSCCDYGGPGDPWPW